MPVVLCTIIGKTGSSPRKEGAKMIVDPDGNTYGTIGGGEMERKLTEIAFEVLKAGKPRSVVFALGINPKECAIPIDSRCGGKVKIFLDVVKPKPRLIIIGSGHIGKPLAHFAFEVGFQTLVVDDAKTTTKARFPTAELRSGPFEKELKDLDTYSSDYVAIVHGELEYELISLKYFLRARTAYIGLLGSRHKAKEISKTLVLNGFTPKDVEKIKSPIGINIGAETPEEIAMSIVSELIKIRRLGAL
jgi:xanthine dehydrogenase accessory factor